MADGQRTLSEDDVVAIREAIFEQAPIAFMDTQRIVIENKALRDERDRLRGWVSKLLEAKDDHVHVPLTERDTG